MPTSELPSGRYISAPTGVRPDAGGQTRALLLRNRIFATQGGVAPVIATFNARTDLDERRAELLERRLLLPEIATPNLFMHYREHDWDDEPEPSQVDELVDLSSHVVDQECLPDGSPFRTVYSVPGVPLPVHDYQRADGSTYLRMKEFDHIDRSTWPRSIQRVARDGTVIGKFGSVAQLYKRFVRDLAGEERTFLFVDSRFMLQHLAPVRAPYVHLVYVLHNIHLLPPRLWSSPLGGIYDRVLDRASDVDAFVTLTGRQRDDIAQRRGSTSNLFVVPNPVDLPEPPAPLPPRDPLRLAVVARIEKQKRVAHAVAAFARVLEKVPDAHLDVYGSGRQSGTVAAAVAKHGVSTSVTLHGFDPHATDSLWSASGFVMTSMFEGYPLSTLESLSRGCPVVSYDIKYGPREQITDGVEGFLVDDGDIEALAERLVRLLTSPQLVARMSEAARRKAAEHDHRHFLEDWGCVLDRIVELKPGRTRLEEVGLEVTRLQLGRTGRWRPSFVPGRIGRRGRLRFEGRLRVSGRSATSDLSSAVVSLAAVHPPSGRCTDLPLSVRRRDDVFELAGSTRLAALFGGADRLDEVRLRLRVVWENSAWETLVGRPDRTKTGVEATYDPQGAMALSVR